MVRNGFEIDIMHFLYPLQQIASVLEFYVYNNANDEYDEKIYISAIIDAETVDLSTLIEFAQKHKFEFDVQACGYKEIVIYKEIYD